MMQNVSRFTGRAGISEFAALVVDGGRSAKIFVKQCIFSRALIERGLGKSL